MGLGSPGPGTYPIRTLVGTESVGKTMSQKLNPSFEKPGANKVPGPGAYSSDYKVSKSKDPQWRIGTSRRDDAENVMRRTCNYPPPDSYNPVYQSTKEKSPNWGFGSSKRGQLTNGKVVSPSMQTYNIPSRAVEGSKWVMGAKLQGSMSVDKAKFAPGPGNYDPDFKKSVHQMPSFSMKGRYKDSKKLDVPGPGTYQKSLVDKKSAPSFGFGSSQQREPIRNTLSPGPGGYKIPTMIGDVPGYAMPNRKDEFKYI